MLSLSWCERIFIYEINILFSLLFAFCLCYEESVYWCVSVRNLCIDVFLWGICVLMCFCEESVYWCVSVRNLCIDVFLWGIFSPPKGAKLYPASRRRSSKRVGLKGQLAPHHVPWLKNYIMAFKRLSTSLGSKTLNTSLGLGGNHNLRPGCRRLPARTFHTPAGTLRLDAPALFWGGRLLGHFTHPQVPSGLTHLHFSESAVPMMAKLSPLSTLPVLRVLFWCNPFDVSSVFWLFFQANLLIILIDPV